jgi:hypothetical protein
LPPVQLVLSALIILLFSSNAVRIFQSFSESFQIGSSHDIWVCQVAKKDPPIRSAIREALVDLFHYIEIVLKRLKIEPDVTVTQAITHRLVEILMQFMSVFAIATKEVNEGLLSESILTGIFPINVALLREICQETTGRKRCREDPTKARSAHLGGGSEDGDAYS